MKRNAVWLYNIKLDLDIEKFAEELKKYNLILYNLNLDLDKSGNIVCVINDPRLSTHKWSDIQGEPFKFVWEKIKDIPIRIAATNLFYTFNKGKDCILKHRRDGKAIYHAVFDVNDFNGSLNFVIEKILTLLSKNKVV